MNRDGGILPHNKYLLSLCADSASLVLPRDPKPDPYLPHLHVEPSIATSETFNLRRSESMSGLPETAAVLSRAVTAASGSIGSVSPTSSPTNTKPAGGRGRKRTLEGAGVVASPESGEDGPGGLEDRRRLPGVKRACNECRQQKVFAHTHSE